MFRYIASLLVFLLAAVHAGWAQTSQEADTLSQQGRAALQAGHYADAEQAYERLKQMEPSVAEIRVALGVIYFKEGKFQKAEIELRHAQQLKPGLPHVDSLLAMVLSELGKFQQALPGLEKGFHQSTDVELKRMCGLRLERAYISIHDEAKAIETALELQHTYSNDPEVLYYSSKVFGNEAFLTAQKLFQIAPGSVWGLMAAGEAHESQGDTDQAIAEYRQVLKLDSTKPNIHFRIGRVLLARSMSRGDLKDSEEAMTEFQQELAMDPSNANAAYELADIYRKQGQEDQARRYFQQAVENYPSFEEAHVGLAVTLMQSDPAQAQVHLRQAIAIDPQDAVAWYRLAQVERLLGHPDAQKQALARFGQLKDQGALSRHVSSNPEVSPQQLDSTDPQ